MTGSIKAIPGIQWAADIMTGQRPLPQAQAKQKRRTEVEDFKLVFEDAVEKVRKENGDERQAVR